MISDILTKLVAELEMRLKDSNIHLELTEEARKYIIDHGFDENYGARPLKRFVSRTVETLLSRMIIEDKITYGMHLIIDVQDEEIVIYDKKES